jgi:tetratricopeptide (TPR) repeat protein
VRNSKTPSVVTLRLGPGWRWLLLLPALLAILGAWFTVRWYVGNTIAEYAPGVSEGGLEMARMAVRWAPGDPLAHWRLGSSLEKSFSAENMAAAVSEYQTAVILSPNDYRYWMELGRALEAGGDQESGEKALHRAVALAPAYSQPRWHFGNLLLREGKYDQAFEQLGHAVESDNQMRRQVFDLGMQVFAGNLDEIAKVTCVSPAARLQFANYLVTAQKIGDAMRMWGAVSAADRRAQPELSKEFEQALLGARQFRAVLTVMQEIEPDAIAAQPEQISNAGFESDFKFSTARTFDWSIISRGSAQVSADSHAHSGNKSLRILFRASATLDKIPVSQTVVVEPGAGYRFECYMRTEDIISPNAPVLTVFDAIDGNALGLSKPVPTGTHDWQLVTFDFTTNQQHDGITIGFSRAPCGEGQICPIFGTVWYDDFNLKRISGPRRDAVRR